MTLWMGKLQVEIMQLGRGHTKGDTVVWLPQERILFSGDLVEYDADAVHRRRLSRATGRRRSTRSRRCKPEEARARPRRGAAERRRRSTAGLDGTRAFITEMFDAVKRGARAGQGPAHRVQGNLRGAEAEVRPLGDLRSLPAVRRDARLRRGDAATAIRASGPRSATRRCGRRWKAEALLADGAPLKTLYQPGLRVRPPAGAGRRRRRRWPVVVVGAGPVGLPPRSISRSAASTCCCSTRTTRSASGSRAICCVEAHARDPRPPGLRRAHRAARASSWNVGQGLLPRRAGLRIRPAAGDGPSPAGVRQPAAVLARAIPGRAPGRAAAGRAALAQQGRRRRAAGATASRCASTRPTANTRSHATG